MSNFIDDLTKELEETGILKYREGHFKEDVLNTIDSLLTDKATGKDILNVLKLHIVIGKFIGWNDGKVSIKFDPSRLKLFRKYKQIEVIKPMGEIQFDASLLFESSALEEKEDRANGCKCDYTKLEAGQLHSELQATIEVIKDSICHEEVPSKYLYDKYILLSSLLKPGNPIIPNDLAYDKLQLAKQLNGRVYETYIEVDSTRSLATEIDTTYLVQRIKSEITGWISESGIKNRYNRSCLNILTLGTLESDKEQDYLKEFVILSVLMDDFKLDGEEEIVTLWIWLDSNKMREALVELHRKYFTSDEFRVEQGARRLSFPVSYLFSK